MPRDQREKGRSRTRRPTTNRAAKMVRLQWLLGLGSTVIVLALLMTRSLDRLEYPSLDFRATRFLRFSPPPSPKVAVAAIDDEALNTVGRWPWPREKLARAIDELRLAGASVIALDLLLDEPQEKRLVGDPGVPGSVHEVDGDADLARAIREHGNVVLGASFHIGLGDESSRRDKVEFNRVYSKVEANARDGREVSLDDLRTLIADQNEAATTSGPVIDDLRLKFEWSKRLVARSADLSLPMPPDTGEFVPWPTSADPEPPAPVIMDAGERIASVSFGTSDLDGTVRRIPLWVRHADRLYPTLGLAAAAAHFGIDVKQMEVSPERTLLHLPDSTVRGLRTHGARYRGKLGYLVGLHYVTWPRGAGWMNQFGFGDKGRPLSLARLVDIDTTLSSVKSNVETLDRNVRVLNDTYGLGNLEGYDERATRAASLTADDPEFARIIALQLPVWSAVADGAAELLNSFAGIADLTDDEQAQKRDLENAAQSIPLAALQVKNGIDNVRNERAENKNRFGGKVVFVGWTATGSLADFVPTSIDPRTPGVLVHAAVVNAVLTQHSLLIGPKWLTVLGGACVALLGIIATLIGVSMGVVVGLVSLLLVAMIWIAIVGSVWDAGATIMTAVPPLLAMALAWLSVIMHRLIVEQRGRKQTEARFRSYVSPDVVDILVNNPDMDTMKPDRRELTIVFTDIAGWTTLSERLGTEGIGTFLRTYLKAMTEALQANRATLDKYIGDGIVAFWGAPIENPDHARDAAKAAIEMMSVLDRMNAEGSFGPAGKVAVRVGLATGEVSVGDFGNPPYKSSYTVIGDAANVAARLEAANRQFGTTILMTERTRSLIGPDLRVRPVGRIVLKGKVEYETLYELIGDRTPRGDRTDQWISVTEDAVEAYIGGRLEECLGHLTRLREEFGDSVFAEVYRHSIDLLTSSGGPPPGWQGTVVLTEK